MEKILNETKLSQKEAPERGRAYIENTYESKVLENYEKMLKHLKYYRAFSQQETKFIDFVEKMNKLENENKELRLKCAEAVRRLTVQNVFLLTCYNNFEKETNMSYIVKENTISQPKEPNIENLLLLLGKLNTTLNEIEIMASNPNIEKELNIIRKQKIAGNEKQCAIKQIDAIKNVIGESKIKLCDSLDFLIESLTK